MSDYCNLMAKGHPKFQGWSYDPTRDLWVCSYCRKPSKAHLILMPSDGPLSDPSAKV